MYDQDMKSVETRVEGHISSDMLDRSDSTVFVGLHDLETQTARFEKALTMLTEKLGPVSYHEDRPTPSDSSGRVTAAPLSPLAGRVRASVDTLDLLVTGLERITNSIDL